MNEVQRGQGRALPAILQPLRHRDYRVFAAGVLVSSAGDGIFLVALPLQVYAISNVPTAMAVVGVAWTTAQLGTLLVGGWAVDHFDRRRIMVAADLVRGGALAATGLLSLGGALELWHVWCLGGVVGIANAFFNPAATSVVPDLLPSDELARANAFAGVARPAMVRLLGPAIGGVVVGFAGTGPAFLTDAGSFLLSAVLFTGMHSVPRSAAAPDDAGLGNSLRSVAEGLRYVRSQRWCWTWMLASAVGLLAFTGPVDMLLPYVVKNDLSMAPRQAAFFLGTVLAAGGFGSVLMALLVGQRGMPRRSMTSLYLAQALGIGLLAVYGAMTQLWQGVAAAMLLNAMFTFTDIVWTTTLQRRVPRHLLGRVSSLDWMAALSAMPLSFVLVGGFAAQVGARPVLLSAALIGSVIVLGLMLVPGARTPEDAHEGLQAAPA